MVTSILLRGGTVLTHGENDRVVPLYSTDVLIHGDTIADIGENLQVSGDVEILDCKGKIVSPGFVNTHHHLWQTQLKGRHAEQGLVKYMYCGNLMSYAYTSSDVYWGQLAGGLESIYSGTTTVLDHAHMVYTAEHALSGLNASLDSGIRSIYAYTLPLRMAQWDQSNCTPSQDFFPEWALPQIKELAHRYNVMDSSSLVEIGYGFDWWFFPKDMVLGILADLRESGIRIVTSHTGRNAFFGLDYVVPKLESYGLLRAPYPVSDLSAKFPFLVLSHANYFADEDYATLAQTGTSISSTPDTEAQMGLGTPVAFHKSLHKPEANIGLGVDTHAIAPSSMVFQARNLLHLTRFEHCSHIVAAGQYPIGDVRNTSEEAFNLLTIRGARSLGLDQVGTIAKGKKADIVVFDAVNSVGISAMDYDPIVAIVRFSEAADIETVIINGVIRKRNGKLGPTRIADGTSMEWKDIAQRVKVSQKEIAQRIDGLSLQKAKEALLGMFQTDQSKLVDATSP